jgi:hypothetical protein
MATFKILVEVTTNHAQGKFASTEEQIASVIEDLENANPMSITGIGADGDSEYDIDEWLVEEVTTK